MPWRRNPGSEFTILTVSKLTKVIVLAVEESYVSRCIQTLLKDDNNQLKIDDAAKIIGCWKALSKQGMTEDLTDDSLPMKRAVAF
jgi:predicted helicase